MQSIWKFEAWRWLMFIAGAVPLYGISRLSIHLLVIGLEGHVPHIAKGALYYVVGIRVSMPCLLAASSPVASHSSQTQGM